MGILEDILEQLTRLAEAAERIANAFDQAPAPPMPGPVAIRAIREARVSIGGIEMDMIRFVVVLPDEPTPDVVKREVTVTFADGTSASVDAMGRAAGDSAEFIGQQDSVVKVSVVNVDDAGNKSEPRVAEFTLVDTFAPAQPGEIGLRATGEETV